MMAGLVDTSVHIQDPGRAVWEGYAAATKAAGVLFFFTFLKDSNKKISKIMEALSVLHSYDLKVYA